jgi:hypothetical protein
VNPVDRISGLFRVALLLPHVLIQLRDTPMLLITHHALVIEPQIEEDSDLRRRLRHRDEQRRWQLTHPDSQRLWREGHREHVRAYKKEWKQKNPEKHREARRRYKKKHSEQVNASNRRRLHRLRSIGVISQSPDAILKRVYASLPSGLPNFIRDDVAGEMLLAALEGKLLVENIARSVGEFTKKYNRQFDTFKTISLDAPIAGTGLRRIDLLVAE